MTEGIVGGSLGVQGQHGQATASPRKHQFTFSGSAGEYFQIWIVNIALTVLTLGIYSAWAKVRTKQYFYRHTNVGGSTFEYLANPISILKGRLIVGGFLALMAASQYVSLAIYGLMAGLLLLATPFLFVQSIKFNARNSELRNIRFSFAGTTGEAYGVFLLAWVLPIVTCGLAYPYAIWRATQFITTRHLYGDERFDWSAKASQYYKLFLAPLLAQLGLVVLIVVAAIASKGDSSEPTKPSDVSPLLILAMLLIYPALFAIAAYIKAHTTNLVYNQLSLGAHRFECNQRARDLIILYFTNALAVLFTLGLLVPWAKVRLARYKAEHLALLAHGPLEVGSNPWAQGASAMGDAATDLGDIGFDFGL